MASQINFNFTWMGVIHEYFHIVIYYIYKNIKEKQQNFEE